MTLDLEDNFDLIIFGKLRRNGPEIDWNSVNEMFQTNYGGIVSEHKVSKGRFSFNCKGAHFEEIISSAESGALDSFMQAHGADHILEILCDDECYYQAVPRSRPRLPKLRNIPTDQLEQEIHRVDILLLTATDIERQAVHAAMNPWPGNDSILQGALKNQVYHLGLLGQYRVAQTSSTMGNLGRQGSTITSIRAIDDVSPKAVIFIGIAFGFDRKKQRLGDIIIAESIFPYELARVGDGPSIHRGAGMQCGIVLSNRFRELRSDWSLQGAARLVLVQQGLMLSGEKLIDNKVFRDSLKTAFPTALGGEMEGAGAYAAAGNAKVEMILVKAVCDWADGHKDDRAHPFAALAAVSLVKHILSKQDALDELGATNASLESLTLEDAKSDEVIRAIIDPWETIRQIAPQLYETGPTEKNVWQRSGGDLSRITVFGDGRTTWDSAIRAIEKGGGGTTLSQLITVMREDYPGHDLLRHLAQSLSANT